MFIDKACGEELISFYRECIRTRSYSDEEGDIARLAVAKMKELGFDEAYIDPAGNAVGRVGTGSRTVNFDSHMDTVRVNDGELWDAPPFSADIKDGFVYGRGAADMKGGLAASVFAAALAKKRGWLDGKTVWVTGTVCEEYCDGVGLAHFYRDSGVKPDFCVICEPSDNVITLGHTGKVQARVTTAGVSAHASAPEKGVNAVYAMADIIKRVDELNARLQAAPGAGTIVLSDISCVSASLNAVPDKCEIYLDRRLRPGETTEQVRGELDALVAGVSGAAWEPGTLRRKSWTGAELVYEPCHDPWKISPDHPLTAACRSAFSDVFGAEPEKYGFWDFGTNAVAPIGMGVPCIGFGPGDCKLAHMRNERCRPEQVVDACGFYAALTKRL